MKKQNKAEYECASKLRSAGIGLVVNFAPNMILVNGMCVASTFDEFRKFCTKHKIEEKNFKNWPFVHHMDGVTPVGASKSKNP